MSLESDFLRLIAQGQDDPEITRDRQIAVLLAHARSTSKHMLDVGGTLAEISSTLTELKTAAAAQQIELAANTVITTTVRDTLTAGRVATRLIKWIGAIALAVASIYGFFVAIKTGKMP